MKRWKVYLCAAVFLLLTAVKMIAPAAAADAREVLLPAINADDDYKSVFAEIRSVYSHQQAIAQSETFLKQFHLPATAMLNTAMAAKFVAESGDKTKAAIASTETAALYGLEVLVPRINTDGDNTTRFIVLSREKPTGGNRFSLLFTVDNKPGKLGEVIQIIGASGFNMESIKSRPMPHVPFEYYFYVELVGDPTADETAALLRELDRTCRTVRLLGVYTK